MNTHIVKLHPHVDPDEANRASAPYNFVPLPDIIVPAVAAAEQLPDHNLLEDSKYRHSGWFKVELTTKSYVFIRGMLTAQQFLRQERKQYVDNGGDLPETDPEFRRLAKNLPHFFNHESNETLQLQGTPIFPGSSLRGMLRNLLEIVSYSKIQPVTDRQLVFRTFDMSSLREHYMSQTVNWRNAQQRHFEYPARNLKAGYLQNNGGKWEIIPAVEPGGFGESFVHVGYGNTRRALGFQPAEHTVHDVYVQPAARSSHQGQRVTLNIALTNVILTSPGTGLVPAKLVVSGNMHGKKWHCAVYERATTTTPIPIDDDVWQLYQADLTNSRARVLDDGSPLFYLLDNTGRLVFFGPTQFFRLPYRNSPQGLVPDMLRRPDVIDFAEALFGYVRNDAAFEEIPLHLRPAPKQGTKARAYAGRVFVTDGNLAEGETDVLHDTVVTPEILATPKPTAVQHYLTQPTIPRRTHGSSYDLTKIHHYDSTQKGEGPILRGYKLYWHENRRSIESIEAKPNSPKVDENGNVDEHSSQHTQFRPIKPDKKFVFKVYFNALSDAELGALCWILHPFGDAELDYCHKIGMAKSLGLGSVSLYATLNLISRTARYERLFTDENSWEDGQIESEVDLSDRQTLSQWIQPFESHIISYLDTGQPVEHLFEIERISMLLKMLEYPGQPPQLPPTISNRTKKADGTLNTRQMLIQLEHSGETINEFKYRPILPSPLSFGETIGDVQPRPSIIQVGMEKTAEVIWVYNEGPIAFAVEFDEFSWQFLEKGIIGQVPVDWNTLQNVHEGNKVYCRIEWIDEGLDEIVLYCRPIEQ